MRKTADGTGEAVVLVEADTGIYSPDWSKDGRYLVYHELTSENHTDIRYVELQNDGEISEPLTFLATSASEISAKLSPDGRFVAYRSNESGRHEIYVGPFPEGTGKWQVSVNGGQHPRWRSDGKELYYVEPSLGQGALMAVSVSTELTFALGQPQRLFESTDLNAGRNVVPYDVSTDGQRFVTVAPDQDGEEDAAPPRSASSKTGTKSSGTGSSSAGGRSDP
jgi:Tol biopolymer transport system component